MRDSEKHVERKELFSNKVVVSDDDGIYYYAMSPVLERRKDGYYQVGSIALLIQNNSIQNICDFAISNYQNGWCIFCNSGSDRKSGGTVW